MAEFDQMFKGLDGFVLDRLGQLRKLLNYKGLNRG